MPKRKVQGATKVINEGYVVEGIVAHKGKPGHRQFRVKWRGFDTTENTWEPEERLREDVPDKVKAYLKRKDIEGVDANTQRIEDVPLSHL